VPPASARLRQEDDDDCKSECSWAGSLQNSEAPSSLKSLTRSMSARSISTTSQVMRFTSAPWDNHHDTCSDVLISTASDASTRTSVTLNSSRSSESLPVPRLRGEGQAIGQSGRGSPGIPWRQIPTYSPSGTMRETRDALGTSEARQREVVMHSKLPAQYSPKLGGSRSMRDVLEPVMEHAKSAPHPVAAAIQDFASSPVGKQSPRQAWIETVKRRQDLKYEKYRDSSSTLSVTSGKDGDSGMHWSYRPQKKGVSTVHNTKDSCPFSRNDSLQESRSVLPATPHRRSPLSPASAGRSDPDPHAFVGERTPQRRRDAHFQQQKSAAMQDARSESASPVKQRGSPAATSCGSGGQQTPQPRWR